MLKPKDLQQMAKRTAKAIKKDTPKPVLSDAQQLQRHHERVAKGHDGFRDITEKHGIGGLTNYLSAMAKLQKKHGK